MSHISYAFNHSDIEATAYALTVLPRLGLAESEAQAEINYQLCCSAASIFSIAGHYLGAHMVVKNGVKVIKPIILLVLVLLMIKIILGI